MSSGYKFNNTDLDDIFKLKKTGASSATLSGFIATNGEDLSARYEASRAAGDRYSNATGYKLKDVDLNTMYMRGDATIIPSFVITPNKTRINETDNRTVIFTIATLDVGAGTTIAWQILDNGTKAPFNLNAIQTTNSGVASITTTTANAGSATIVVTAVQNLSNVGTKSFIAEITLPGGQKLTSDVVELIAAEQPTPSYTLTSNATTINRGDSVTFTATVTNTSLGDTLRISCDPSIAGLTPAGRDFTVTTASSSTFTFTIAATGGFGEFRAVLTRAGGVLARSPVVTVE